ncbi:MAG: hypothetical protein ACLP1X_28890 [Polyangiaceae bacterium]
MCRRPLSSVLLLLAAGCSSSTGGDTASREAGPVDARPVDDGGSTDAAEPDTGNPADGATPGTGPGDGAGPSFDASAAVDAGLAGDAGAVMYSTDFPLTENPISEGGHWIHLGTPWSLVATGGGVAYGTQPGDGAYTDSYAHLSGFPPNQSVTVTIHIDAGFSPGGTREVEIHLRWADSASSASGYECNLAYDGAYAEVVRWNGPLGDYTYVSPQGSGGPGAVHDGDAFKAQIVGTVVTTWLNGQQLQQVDVASIGGMVWTEGDPGMGFWRGAGASATPGDYGFSSYAATSLP